MLQQGTYQHLPARQFGAVLLCLLLLIVGQFKFQFQHYLEHSLANEVLHDEQAEADACHQAIFHNRSHAACEHPTHLTATNADCELCDCLLQLTDFRLLTIKLSPPPLVNQSLFTFLSPIAGEPFLSATARGPPLYGVYNSTVWRL
jgi:hypothetical protein